VGIAVLAHAILAAPFLRAVHQTSVAPYVEVEALSLADERERAAIAAPESAVPQTRAATVSAHREEGVATAIGGTRRGEGSGEASHASDDAQSTTEPPGDVGEPDGGEAPLRERPSVASRLALDAELSNRDVFADQERALQRARSGPLVAAANVAANAPAAPEHGASVVVVECDAHGTVVSARADNSLWDRIADDIVDAMRGKTVPGAMGTGLRSRLRVVAQIETPDDLRSVGLAPLAADVPTAFRLCMGSGPARRCIGGAPPGSRYGKKPRASEPPKRAVRVEILGEDNPP
jgi:hypothetical protein